MTLQTDDDTRTYANPAGTSFNGPPAFVASTLFLYVVESDGVTRTLIPSSDYTVSQLGRNLGTRIVLDAPIPSPAGKTLLIQRTVPYNQLTDITNQGDFNAQVLEGGLDTLGMQTQQLARQVGRALRFPDNVLVDFDPVIPTPLNPLDIIQVRPDGLGFVLNPAPQIATVAPGAVVDETVSPSAGIKATKLAWTASGAGALEEAIQEELRRVIRPEHYGAKGDGVTDDLAAFNLARNALLARPCGGVILCQPGKTYAFSARWSITKTVGKQVIVDMNGSTFTKTGAGWAGAIMYFGNPTDVAGAYPLILRNGIFQGVGASGTGLILEWGSNSVISNVVFRNFVQSASLTNSFAVRFEKKCQFLYNDTAAILCNTEAHNLTVDGCGGYVNQRDIYFPVGAPAYNINIVNCDFEGSLNAGSNAIVLDGGGANINIKGCYIEGKNGQPIVFGSAVSALNVENNWIGFNTGAQQWGNINSGVLEGNVFWDQTQSILSTVKDFDIGNNAYAGTANQIFTPWTALPLINGFSNTLGSYAAAGYRKDRNGVVWLRGMVQAAADNSCATLPVGYRPAALTPFLGLSAAGGVASLGRVQVSAGGAVSVFRTADTSCSLDMVRFVAAG